MVCRARKMCVNLPGYVGYRKAKTQNSHRGGTVVFVKNCLSRFVKSVDLSIDDQVWLRLECAPTVLFRFSYVPPSDSPSLIIPSQLFTRIADSESSHVMVMGDLNTRFGAIVRDVLHDELSGRDTFPYPLIPDEAAAPQ